MLFNLDKQERSTIHTQNGGRQAKTMDDVNACLGVLFNNRDEFVVLTLADSKIKHGIQYIQSAWTADGLTLQAGVIENGKIRLVEKIISPFDCEKIYKKFFETSEVDNIKEFTEVRF